MKRRWWCPFNLLLGEANPEEVHEVLQRIEERDPEISELGERLRAARKRNNFSPAVEHVLRRIKEEGP